MRVTSIFVGALLVLAPTAALADLSGDLVVRVKNPDGETIEQTGKIFIDGDAFESRTTRVEMTGPAGNEVVMITRGEEDKAFLVLPELKSYSEVTLDEAKGNQGPGAGLQRDDFKIERQETLDGMRTDVGVADVKDDQGQVIGKATVHFAKKLDGAPVKSRIDLDNGSSAETIIKNPSNKQIEASQFQPPNEYNETQLPLFHDPFSGEMTAPTL